MKFQRFHSRSINIEFVKEAYGAIRNAISFPRNIDPFSRNGMHKTGIGSIENIPVSISDLRQRRPGITLHGRERPTIPTEIATERNLFLSAHVSVDATKINGI